MPGVTIGASRPEQSATRLGWGSADVDFESGETGVLDHSVEHQCAAEVDAAESVEPEIEWGCVGILGEKLNKPILEGAGSSEPQHADRTSSRAESCREARMSTSSSFQR